MVSFTRKKVDTVKIEYPLKQGLKLYFPHKSIEVFSLVKIEYPLKQGLNYLLKTTTFI